MFPKSRADALALSAREYSRCRCEKRIRIRVCAKETRGWSGGSAAPILMCESLGTITAITGPVASQHTIRVRGHFAVSHALFHSRFAQILLGLPSTRPTHLRATGMLRNRVANLTIISSRIKDAANVSTNSTSVYFAYYCINLRPMAMWHFLCTL